MKSTKYLFLFVLVPLLFCSCEEDDLTDFFSDPEIDINTSFAIPLTIDEGANPDPNEMVGFGQIGGYDILTNPDIAEQVGEDDRIERVVITSVTYEFRNFSGNVDANVQGTMEFPVGSGPNEVYNMPSVNAAESDLLENVYNLNGDFTSVSERITESKNVVFSYSGTSTHNPVSFILEVIVNVRVTVRLNIDDL